MIIAKTLLLPLSISMLLSLSACTPPTDNNDHTSSSVAENLEANQQTAAVAAPVVESPTSASVQKQDLADLLGWFEEGCGFGKYTSDAEPVPSATEQRYIDFKQTFMSESYDATDEPIASVTANYQLPMAYRDAVQDISVEQDNEGVHYYVNFSNASYRSYELDKLEVFYAPESDYLYDVMHFKNADFMALKPQFRGIYDQNLDSERIGTFDEKAQTVTCYMGL